MHSIVASSTERYTIAYIISKISIVRPLLDVVYYAHVFARDIFRTLLASHIISYKTFTTPLFIKNAVEVPRFSRYADFRLGPLRCTDLSALYFAVTLSRTPPSLVSIIRKCPIRFSTYFTILKNSSFLHNYIVLEYYYEV